jgi:hypothetical protein
MKCFPATLLALFLAASAQGADLTICMAPNADFTIFGAQSIVSRIYERIGVRILWSRQTKNCPGIVVKVTDRTPQAAHPGSLAVSTPYGENEIVVYYDRIRAVSRNETATLLGYIVAHEIAHIAQGISRHSNTGILKARWDTSDHASMRRAALYFADDDFDLIQRGLRNGSTGETGAQ